MKVKFSFMNIRPFELKDENVLRKLFKQLTGREILLDLNKGLTGVVEDVIVDEKYRGQGLGKMIMNKLLEVARENDLKQITLTSNPSRTVARKLYQDLGFELCDTGFFKKIL